MNQGIDPVAMMLCFLCQIFDHVEIVKIQYLWYFCDLFGIEQLLELVSSRFVEWTQKLNLDNRFINNSQSSISDGFKDSNLLLMARFDTVDTAATNIQ
jgi:hypothetical protein